MTTYKKDPDYTDQQVVDALAGLWKQVMKLDLEGKLHDHDDEQCDMCDALHDAWDVLDVMSASAILNEIDPD